jgi:hypothetical protein
MLCACGSGLDESVGIGGVRVSRNSDNLVRDSVERTLTQIASGQGLTSSGTAIKMLVAVGGSKCADSHHINSISWDRYVVSLVPKA